MGKFIFYGEPAKKNKYKKCFRKTDKCEDDKHHKYYIKDEIYEDNGVDFESTFDGIDDDFDFNEHDSSNQYDSHSDEWDLDDEWDHVDDDWDSDYESDCCEDTKHKKGHHHCYCDKDHKSKGCCICEIIWKFIDEDVTIRTKSGDTIEGIIKHFDKKSKCVVILEPGMVSPLLPERKTIICCEDIESISKEIWKDDLCY